MSNRLEGGFDESEPQLPVSGDDGAALGDYSGKDYVESILKKEISSDTQEQEPIEPKITWQPLIEKQTKNPDQNAAIEGRKFLAEQLFSVKSPQASERRQQLMQETKTRLVGTEQDNKAAKLFARMPKGDKEVVLRLIDDVSQSNIPFDELLDRASDSPRQLRAVQLIGLSLLGEAINGDKQKGLSELTEGQRRNVEVGQLLAMEASRRMAEMRMQRGGVNANQARVMQERFEQLSNHAVLPEKYQRQFAESSRKFAEKAEPRTAPKTVRHSRPKIIESVPEPIQAELVNPTQGEVQNWVYELGQNAAEHVTDESEMQFLRTLDKQVGYAESVREEQRLPVLARMWRKVGNVGYKWDVRMDSFGVLGAIASTDEMIQLRDRVVNRMVELQNTASAADRSKYSKVIDSLMAVNRIEDKRYQRLRAPTKLVQWGVQKWQGWRESRRQRKAAEAAAAETAATDTFFKKLYGGQTPEKSTVSHAEVAAGLLKEETVDESRGIPEVEYKKRELNKKNIRLKKEREQQATDKWFDQLGADGASAPESPEKKSPPAAAA